MIGKRGLIVALVALVSAHGFAAEAQESIGVVFQKGLDAFNSGKNKEAMTVFGGLVDKRWDDLSPKGQRGAMNLLMACQLRKSEDALARVRGAEYFKRLPSAFMSLKKIAPPYKDEALQELAASLHILPVITGKGGSALYLHNSSDKVFGVSGSRFEVSFSFKTSKMSVNGSEATGKGQPPSFEVPAGKGVILYSSENSGGFLIPDVVCMIACRARDEHPNDIQVSRDQYKQTIKKLLVAFDQVRWGAQEWKDQALIDDRPGESITVAGRTFKAYDAGTDLRKIKIQAFDKSEMRAYDKPFSLSFKEQDFHSIFVWQSDGSVLVKPRHITGFRIEGKPAESSVSFALEVPGAVKIATIAPLTSEATKLRARDFLLSIKEARLSDKHAENALKLARDLGPKLGAPFVPWLQKICAGKSSLEMPLAVITYWLSGCRDDKAVVSLLSSFRAGSIAEVLAGLDPLPDAGIALVRRALDAIWGGVGPWFQSLKGDLVAHRRLLALALTGSSAATRRSSLIYLKRTSGRYDASLAKALSEVAGRSSEEGAYVREALTQLKEVETERLARIQSQIEALAGESSGASKKE